MGPLVVIPTFLRKPRELEVTAKTWETLRATESELEVMFVDDGSPDQGLVDLLEKTLVEDSLATVFRKDKNTGFSSTVNIGLKRCLEEKRDAILCNADIEFVENGWLERLLITHDTKGNPAAVVGCLLLYPNGLIQHAGVYASFLDRSFDHRMRFAPGSLPEAHEPKVCPVTGALQLIRYSTLERVGVYDENFRMAFEDVDYCLRVFDAGLECVYQPGVMAVHHESLFRGDASDQIKEWTSESLQTLMKTHAATDIGRWIPAFS